MSSAPGLLSTLPPIIAIGFALATRRILLALFAGVLSAAILLNLRTLPIVPARTVDYLVTTLAREDNLRLVLFSVLVGGLLKLMKDGGSFDAFADALTRGSMAGGRAPAYGLTWLLGSTLILETWSNVLINGSTCGPLYDRLGMARVRLAYFIHTIGINVVALVLVNSWGAFYLGLLNAQHVADPLDFLVRSIPYILYCWLSLLVVAFVMFKRFSLGPMREFDRAALDRVTLLARDQTPDARPNAARARHAFMPIVALLGTVLLSLWLTGDGNITRGDGSASVLYAVVAALLVVSVLLSYDRVLDAAQIAATFRTGCSEFLGVAVLIVLALALGSLTKQLGTGTYIAQLLQSAFPAFTLPAIIFVIGAVMSFATGTSYGTFSILVPLALAVSDAAGTPAELLFGACIAGGVFGDNASPISDTTLVSSIAAGTTVIDHARTQLPYALVTASLATAGYLLLGAII